MSRRFFTRTKCSIGFKFFRAQALAKNSSTDMASRKYTVACELSGQETLYDLSASSREPPICIERRLEPLFERDRIGGLRFVAPRPASKLLSSDGDRAQMNAWNEDTVKTPSLFSVFFVGRDTWVKSD